MTRPLASPTMAGQPHQCPFINRPGERCSEHFHLDDLNHAFEFCFNRFKRCPVYVERLVEWRLSKRAGGGDGCKTAVSESRPPLVQVTIPARYAQPLAAA